MQIYISASNSSEDRRLLYLVQTHLRPLARRLGCQIASSDEIAAGSDTRSERLRLLAQADLLLLLLSPDYVAQCEQEASEAVHQRRRGAAVVPLRLRPCLYQDETYGGLAALPVEGPTLSERPGNEHDATLVAITTELAEVLRKLAARAKVVVATSRLPPPAAAYDPAYYVRHQKLERRALRCLADPGALVLQAPRDFGKGTVLGYLCAQAASSYPGLRVVRIQMNLLREQEPDDLDSLESLLRRLGLLLTVALLPASRTAAEALVAEVWAQPGTGLTRLHRLLEQHLLIIADPLLLCIEQLDQIRGSPYQPAFLAMLRSWVREQRAPWHRLRLVTTVSTEPMLLQSTDPSGFIRHATVLEVPSLSRAQATELAAQYGFIGAVDGLDQVYQEVNGHPLLLRRWLHEAAMEEVTLPEVERMSVVRGHLFELKRDIMEQKLLPALVRVVEGKPLTNDEEYGALYRLGLIQADSTTRNSFRSPLYEAFVKELCERLL